MVGRNGYRNNEGRSGSINRTAVSVSQTGGPVTRLDYLGKMYSNSFDGQGFLVAGFVRTTTKPHP